MWCAILFMSDEYYENLKVDLGYIYLLSTFKFFLRTNIQLIESHDY